MPTPQKRAPTKQRPGVFGALPPDENESHEDSISRSLRVRLKGVCAKLSPEDFEALIATMTREQLRGEKSSRR